MIIEIFLLGFALLQASILTKAVQKGMTFQERVGALFAGVFGVCFSIYFISQIFHVIS